MTVEKLSLSFERQLAKRIRTAARKRGVSVSAFVGETVDTRLKLDELALLLKQWDDEFGPVPEEVRREVDELWPP